VPARRSRLGLRAGEVAAYRAWRVRSAAKRRVASSRAAGSTMHARGETAGYRIARGPLGKFESARTYTVSMPSLLRLLLVNGSLGKTRTSRAHIAHRLTLSAA